MKLPVKYDELNPATKRAVRLAYIEEQVGKCYYCKGLLNEMPPDIVMAKRVNKNLYPYKFFEHPIHLHHDHNSGYTLGSVHAYCNAVLWEHHGE